MSGFEAQIGFNREQGALRSNMEKPMLGSHRVWSVSPLCPDSNGCSQPQALLSHTLLQQAHCQEQRKDRCRQPQVPELWARNPAPFCVLRRGRAAAHQWDRHKSASVLTAQLNSGCPGIPCMSPCESRSGQGEVLTPQSGQADGSLAGV